MFIFITLLVSTLTLIYIYFKRCYTYWQKKGLEFLTPRFPLGNLLSPYKWVTPVVQFQRFHEELKLKGCKHGGVYLFSAPVYIPIDPEYVKNILIKDFHHFVDRGIYHNDKDQPIIGNLFFIEGIRWKMLRNKLTSTFTSGKMRMMFDTMLNCASPLRNKIEELSVNDEVIDVKEVFARFTTDVIGSCAFGIDCDSFQNHESDFRKYGRKIFDDTVLKNIRGVFQFAFPNISKKLGLLVLDKDVEDFFNKIALNTYQYRKKNDVKRNDFMQLLIELKDKESNPEEKMDAITMNELIAQAFIFFIAGFDTSSTAMTFCLYELAKNLDLQWKVRDEIRSILGKNDGKNTYDVIKEMKYLHQVVEETLRKYPPLALLNRVCTETYKIPKTDISLTKGTQVGISVLGLHRDPEHYPHPEKFDPDRFSVENRGNIRSGTYIPFGDGPRVCIGLRFGLMQIKIGLIALLKDFEFTVNAKTVEPLEIDLGFILTAKGGVWLNSRKL